MTSLYTAIGTNQGLYLALGVVAHSKAQAEQLLAAEFESAAQEDAQEIDPDRTQPVAGYVVEPIKQRVQDENGEYLNEDGSESEAISATDSDFMWANPGTVHMLSSGVNG